MMRARQASPSGVFLAQVLAFEQVGVAEFVFEEVHQLVVTGGFVTPGGIPALHELLVHHLGGGFLRAALEVQRGELPGFERHVWLRLFGHQAFTTATA